MQPLVAEGRLHKRWWFGPQLDYTTDVHPEHSGQRVVYSGGRTTTWHTPTLTSAAYTTCASSRQRHVQQGELLQCTGNVRSSVSTILRDLRSIVCPADSLAAISTNPS